MVTGGLKPSGASRVNLGLASRRGKGSISLGVSKVKERSSHVDIWHDTREGSIRQ